MRTYGAEDRSFVGTTRNGTGNAAIVARRVRTAEEEKYTYFGVARAGLRIPSIYIIENRLSYSPRRAMEDYW